MIVMMMNYGDDIAESDRWKHIHHSLDVWHKSKKIVEELGSEAKKARNRKLFPWLRHIVRHFWYACSRCKGSKVILRDIWTSILYHINNIHKWPGGKCKHASDTQTVPVREPERDWLAMPSSAYKCLR